MRTNCARTCEFLNNFLPMDHYTVLVLHEVCFDISDAVMRFMYA